MNGLGYSDQDDEATVTVDESEYANPKNCDDNCANYERQKRADTRVNSRIIDVMMATPQFQLNSAEEDVFSFLRDKYELPKGE